MTLYSIWKLSWLLTVTLFITPSVFSLIPIQLVFHTRWAEEVKKAMAQLMVSLGCSMHLASKQLHYKIGQNLIARLANKIFLLGTGYEL